MKKIILCLFALTFFGHTTNAQKLKFGLQLGLNLADASLEQTETGQIDYEATLRTAFNGGIYTEISFLKDKLAIRPGIIYSAEGFVNNVERTTGQDEEVATNMNFMNIPMTIVYKPVKFLNIQFGPEFGYLFRAVADGETITDAFNQSELGLNFGLGTTVGKVLDINLRYNRGLTKTYDGSPEELIGEEASANSGNVSVLNNMFQVSLGLNISGLMNKNN